MYREFVEAILIPILTRLQGVINQRSGNSTDIGIGISGLSSTLHLLDQKEDPVPPGSTTISSNWTTLVLEELMRVNQNGTEGITSLSEALLKIQGIMNPWHAGNRRRYFFRGQHNYAWDIISRCARAGLQADRSQPFLTTAGEINFLRNFQSRVAANHDLNNEIFPAATLHADDPAWWSVMQHYDDIGGTRMVDITSSVFCGLYFACADWDGTVDENNDGALYLLPDIAQWRADTDTPDLIGKELVGSEDRRSTSALSYFNVHDFADILRYREAPDRNDRLIAQDGSFIWQPLFDDPLNLSQHFKFRVSRSNKVRILQELYSIGYTARRIVRGTTGEQAHQRICNVIGVTP